MKLKRPPIDQYTNLFAVSYLIIWLVVFEFIPAGTNIFYLMAVGGAMSVLAPLLSREVALLGIRADKRLDKWASSVSVRMESKYERLDWWEWLVLVPVFVMCVPLALLCYVAGFIKGLTGR